MSNSAAAKAHFKLLAKAFDSKGWRYKTDEDNLTMTTSFRGDDLSMPIIIKIDAERDIIRLHSVLETKFGEDKRAMGSVATSLINWRVVNGCFDYDMSDGQVVFRIVQSYRNCTLSEDVIIYLVNCLVGTVDDYNDVLTKMARGEADFNDLQRRINE